MPADNGVPDAMHLRSLRLENVRAFGHAQNLDFITDSGAISRWNLILGGNGVGKTTLLQALEVMLPVSDFPPSRSKAKLSEYENEEMMHFIRRGGARKTIMAAVFQAGRRKLEIGVEIKGRVDKLKSAEFPAAGYRLRSGGPLVIKYGAGRHLRHGSSPAKATDVPTTSFSEVTALCDAEKILVELDHAVLSERNRKNSRERMRLNALKTIVAALLPGRLTAKDIEIRGPRRAGKDQSGVLVKTPSGKTPFADLSFGYQTMLAWGVDLASRLFDAYPKNAEPLSQSAIVLIDEIELHLHPQWQRDLRERLLENFPKVQFIATTHSPITAQDALSQGGNVAVVRWEGNEAHILNRPIPADLWRYDQLLVSDLFGLTSDRSKEAEAMFDDRLKLLQIRNRSARQETRLRELNELIARLPTARSPIDQRFEDLTSELVRDFPQRRTR